MVRYFLNALLVSAGVNFIVHAVILLITPDMLDIYRYLLAFLVGIIAAIATPKPKSNQKKTEVDINLKFN